MAKRIQNRLETQTTIFEAALELIEDQGYDDTSVEEICASAGVSRATFFRYFETKAGLLREYNRRLTEDAQTRLDALPTTDAVTRFEAIRDTIYDNWIHASPGLRRLGADAAAISDPTGQSTHPELYALVLRVVRDGLAAGELHTELPPRLAAYLAVTHLAAAAAWWFDHPDDDLRHLVDRALEQCLRGIGVEIPVTRDSDRVNALRRSPQGVTP